VTRATEGGSRPPRPPRVDRRQAVLDAAIELFAEKEYDDVSVADIAARAGVAHGLPFYYFDGKRGIMAEGLRQVLDALRTFQNPRADETTTHARLLGFVRRHLEFVSGHRAGYQALLHGAVLGHAEVRTLLAEARHDAAAMIADIIGTSVPLAPMDRLAINGWIALLDTCSDELVADDSLDIDTLAAWAVDALLTGPLLRPTTETPSH
jgi:AcrR family transcriptional regulator